MTHKYLINKIIADIEYDEYISNASPRYKEDLKNSLRELLDSNDNIIINKLVYDDVVNDKKIENILKSLSDKTYNISKKEINDFGLELISLLWDNISFTSVFYDSNTNEIIMERHNKSKYYEYMANINRIKENYDNDNQVEKFKINEESINIHSKLDGLFNKQQKWTYINNEEDFDVDNLFE